MNLAEVGLDPASAFSRDRLGPTPLVEVPFLLREVYWQKIAETKEGVELR
jgi:hypothetical protein